MNRIMHQGDVGFFKLSDVPQTDTKPDLFPSLEGKGIVLHHGEALGHYHSIPETTAIQPISLTETDSVKVMRFNVLREVEVVHEEHGPLLLTPGTWEARSQRESVRGMTRIIAD